MKRIVAAASATDAYGAKAKDAAKNALVYLNALDLAEHNLQGTSADESDLDHHALSGYAKLGRKVAYERRDASGDEQYECNDANTYSAFAATKQHNGDDKPNDRPQENDPVQLCPIHNILARKQITVDVVHCTNPLSAMMAQRKIKGRRASAASRLNAALDVSIVLFFNFLEIKPKH